MRGTLHNTTGGAALAAAILTASAMGQQPATAAPAAGIAVYQPGFFEAYAPVTALDVVQRVPGFSLSNGNTNRRGLGDSFGNLLINGQRPSNKSLELQTVLQRIAVADIVRIELIQEALPQYDMRGHSRLVNVVLREGATRSGSWDVRVQLSDSGRVGPRGEFSYTSPVGPAEVTLGLDTGFSGNRVRRNYARFDGSEQLIETKFDNDQRHYEEVRPSISVNWPISARQQLRVDAQGQAWAWRRRNVGFVDAPSGAPLRFEQNATENHGSSWSVSATYSLDVSDTVSLETIGLASRERWNDGPEAYENYDPVSGFIDAVIVTSSGRYEETALRQTLAWDPNAHHSLEFGAEAAINARDGNLDLVFDDGVTRTPIDLPVANTRVEETRGELFANHVWAISDTLNLESGLRYEYSEIVQTGDADQAREFSYAKPSVTLNWRVSETDRLRFTGRRDVDQLQFGKFASSIDISDNNATLGNPDYVPQRMWTLEAEWERRFCDECSMSIVVGRDWVQDLDDFVPIVTPNGVFDAPGNIGDATRTRVTTNITTPLDSVGLSNAVLDIFVEWYDTNVEDPLTGEDRVWSGPREWELGLDFVQNFPALQMAWGWDYNWRSNGEVFRAQEYRVFDGDDGDLDVYVETTRWLNATLRVGVDGLFNNGDDRQRVFYDGSRALGVVEQVEFMNESRGKTVFVRLFGTF
ncbi:TonB-dependent receptor plug domain-containing protein [Maricaulis sp. CAU 1757]